MPRRAKQPNGQLTDYGVQPVQVPKNQPYGEAKQLADAQRAVPLANLRPDVTEMQRANEVEAFDPFAGITPLDSPTRYPNEPVTSGLATGPGPGPEAMLPRPRARIVDALMALAEATNDPEIRALAMENLGR